MRRALRSWARQASGQRTVTAFMVLSLAIALGGGAFALSLNSAVLWRSLPFANARELVSIEPKTEDGQQQWLSWLEFDVVLPMQAEPDRIANPSRGLFERTAARTVSTANLESARASAPILLDRVRRAGGARPPASLAVSGLQSALFADLRPQLTVVLWLAVVVFSLAGINVLISTIAQAAERSRGTAIRLAVGASHARLLVDGVKEHAITFAVAAALGILLAQWLVAAVGSQMPAGWLSRIPGQLSALRVDGYTLLGVFGALGATLLLGSAAVHLMTRRLAPWSLLGTAGAHETPQWRGWRSGLVGIEIALCSAVVITSVTMIAQLTALRSVDMGIDRTRTSAVLLHLGSTALVDPAARVAYYDRILNEVSALDGIESIGGVSHPFTLGWQSVQVRDASDEATPAITALARSASPTYPGASGIPLVEGRWFDGSDRANAPAVAVVSASLARARWPQQPAVGQQVETRSADGPSSVATVIGVVGDIRHVPHLPPDLIVYRAVAQEPPPWLYLIVRVRPGAGDAMRAVSDAIWRVNPDQSVDGPWVIADWVDSRTSHLRFVTSIALVLGGVGVVLASAGLYALTAWSVASSRRSIAVRRAIGASDTQIRSWFIAQWARIVVPGLVGGWMLQWAWSSLLVSAIVGLQAPSASAVALGVGLMFLAAAGAAAIPLRRALDADTASLMR